jgi:hypothetical protein
VGLENRIVAGLQAERSRLRERLLWRLGAALVMVLVAVAVWVTRPSKPAPSLGAQMNSNPPAFEPPPHVDTEINSAPIAKLHEPRPLTALARRHSSRNVESLRRPTLNTFPSAAPLSEQEKLLLAYVKLAPEEELARVVNKPANIEPLKISPLTVPALEIHHLASELTYQK